MNDPTSAPSLPEAPARRFDLLYVEDNAANLALVEQLISRRAELRLFSAVNGQCGLEMARSHQPDVILLDIQLPDLSGRDIFTLLHDSAATSHIPVIALSSNAYPRQIEQCLGAGFFRYLSKPFQLNHFWAALDAALLRAEQNRRA